MSWPMVEWLWTLLGLVAFVFGLWNDIDARKDKQANDTAIRTRRDAHLPPDPRAEGRARIATTAIRLGYLLTFGPAVILLMGVLALLREDSPTPPSVATSLFLVQLLLVNAVFVGCVLVIRFGRLR